MFDRVRLLTTRATTVVCAIALPWAAPAGQTVPAPTRLTAPNATLTALFTSVTAVRELSDGRVLIVDEGDGRLVVARFAADSPRQIGRGGSGVGEYRAIRRLFPLAADSALLPDPANGRWLIVARDSIASMLSPATPVVRALGSAPLGADSAGFMIATKPRLIDGAPRLDSLMLVRASRRDSGIDTLGALLNRRPNLPSGRIDPTQAVAVTFNPLAVGEQAVLFIDGWIAVARLRPYRVEWIAPDGRRFSGPLVPFESIRVDEREKTAAVEREAQATARAPRDINAVGEWPDVVPAFLGNALLAAPDGTLWIQRAPSRNAPDTRYDVVGRSGTLVRRFVLDESERVVGFGRRAVYTVRVDADGLQQLRRHSYGTSVPR